MRLATVVTSNEARGSQARQDYPGAYQRFYGELAAMLRGGRAPQPVTPQDALAGLEIIEAAQRSAAEHRVVALEHGGGLFSGR